MGDFDDTAIAALEEDGDGTNNDIAKADILNISESSKAEKEERPKKRLIEELS